MKTVEEAKAAMLVALPYFRREVEKAKQKGQVKLAILARPIGDSSGGSLEMTFDCDEFFEDIGIIIGAPAQTDEDNAKADAVKFKTIHGFN